MIVLIKMMIADDFHDCFSPLLIIVVIDDD